jgi:hypothetical protein
MLPYVGDMHGNGFWRAFSNALDYSAIQLFDGPLCDSMFSCLASNDGTMRSLNEKFSYWFCPAVC